MSNLLGKVKCTRNTASKTAKARNCDASARLHTNIALVFRWVHRLPLSNAGTAATIAAIGIAMEVAPDATATTCPIHCGVTGRSE